MIELIIGSLEKTSSNDALPSVAKEKQLKKVVRETTRPEERKSNGALASPRRDDRNSKEVKPSFQVKKKSTRIGKAKATRLPRGNEAKNRSLRLGRTKKSVKNKRSTIPLRACKKARGGDNAKHVY